jgi:mono/diheme cytochrome c family protein
MLASVLVLLVLLLIAGLFAFLAVLAARARRAVVKWPSMILAGLLAITFLLVAGLIGRGMYLASIKRNYPVASVAVDSTPERLARGEHLAQTVCAACHTADGETLPLSGGPNLSEDTGLPLGDLYPPNLTPAGTIATWTDGEILRAIREGVHQSGRQLVVMPVQRLRNLSDEDAYAVVAYLRSQAAIENEVPRVTLSPLAYFMAGANMVTFQAAALTGPITAPQKAATAEYGEYVISYVDCRDCHGEQLDGEVSPPTPPGPNLALVKGWTAEQFVTTLRAAATHALAHLRQDGRHRADGVVPVPAGVLQPGRVIAVTTEEERKVGALPPFSLLRPTRLGGAARRARGLAFRRGCRAWGRPTRTTRWPRLRRRPAAAPFRRAG